MILLILLGLIQQLLALESFYPLLYLDLSYQAEQVPRDPKQLILRYRINQASTVDFQVHAIVLYEKDVVIDKVGD